MFKRRIICCFILLLVVFCSACVSYLTTYTHEGNWEYSLSSEDKGYMLGTYIWDGSTESMEVDLPKELYNIKVVGLGGVINEEKPMEFKVDVQTYLQNHGYYLLIKSDEATDDDYEILQFRINVGKNIRQINNFSGDYYLIKGLHSDDDFMGYGSILDDSIEEDTIYKVEYYFVCSDKNKYLYSEDGKLYSYKEEKD